MTSWVEISTCEVGFVTWQVDGATSQIDGATSQVDSATSQVGILTSSDGLGDLRGRLGDSRIERGHDELGSWVVAVESQGCCGDGVFATVMSPSCKLSVLTHCSS